MENILNFTPGPSTIYEKVPQYFSEGIQDNFITSYHRSKRFLEIYPQIEYLFSQKLSLPKDYKIAFVSSATECWEILSTFFSQYTGVYLSNGEFGAKAYQATLANKTPKKWISYHHNEEIPLIENAGEFEFIHLVHNETSNGTILPENYIQNIRKSAPDSFIAIDATSSMAGINLDFSLADIWYASVQKCFGLPAGMAIMVFSPKIIEYAQNIKSQDTHIPYNHLSNIIVKALQYQTLHTPNLSNIYLLMRVLEEIESIDKIEKKLCQRALEFRSFMLPYTDYAILGNFTQTASTTVWAVEASESKIKILSQNAFEENIWLGKGYGKWANQTFRIANFPAIKDENYTILYNFLKLKF